MACVVAIDAGTTGVRSIAFDEAGKPVASAYQEFPQYFPQPGWVEHDAVEIWSVVEATLASLVKQIDQPIAAIGVASQRETVVVWDKTTGEPLHRAIVWQDRRTAERCNELADAGHLEMVRTKTGLVLDSYFSATKLEWLIRGGDVTPTSSTVFGTVDSWVIWKLTGGAVHVTDPSNASRTMLYDIGAREWSDELLDLFGIPASMMPDVHPSSSRVAVTGEELPLPAGVPISGIAGDQQAALFGQACFSPGDAKNTYGTGSFVLMNVGTQMPKPVDGLLTTLACSVADDAPNYVLEGAIFVTGAAIQWLRDGLGIIDDASEMGALAESVESSEDVFIVPAFAGLGSPWWDPNARGTIVGLTRGSTRAHVARATVEAMAFQTRDALDVMVQAGGVPIEHLRVDGGASAMGLLLQVQADQLGVAVHRSAIAETTALGAAYLAGIAEGVWSGTEEVAEAWQSDAIAAPAGDRMSSDQLHARWLQAVDRSRNWV